MSSMTWCGTLWEGMGCKIRQRVDLPQHNAPLGECRKWTHTLRKGIAKDGAGIILTSVVAQDKKARRDK